MDEDAARTEAEHEPLPDQLPWLQKVETAEVRTRRGTGMGVAAGLVGALALVAGVFLWAPRSAAPEENAIRANASERIGTPGPSRGPTGDPGKPTSAGATHRSAAQQGGAGKAGKPAARPTTSADRHASGAGLNQGAVPKIHSQARIVEPARPAPAPQRRAAAQAHRHDTGRAVRAEGMPHRARQIVQLGAFSTRRAAKAAAKALKAGTGGLDLRIVQAQVHGRHVYRVRFVGPGAARLCRRHSHRSCFIVRAGTRLRA